MLPEESGDLNELALIEAKRVSAVSQENQLCIDPCAAQRSMHRDTVFRGHQLVFHPMNEEKWRGVVSNAINRLPTVGRSVRGAPGEEEYRTERERAG